MEQQQKLDVIQKQMNKTFSYNNVQKTIKTTITILGDEENGLFIDSNDLMRDPTILIHIAKWAGYKVVNKFVDADGKSTIDWSELKTLMGDTPWSDLGRNEKWAIREKKLQWMLERFDFYLPEAGKEYLHGIKLTNASLGHEGWGGEPDVPGTVKSPTEGTDFMTYRKKVYSGSGNFEVKYSE